MSHWLYTRKARPAQGEGLEYRLRLAVEGGSDGINARLAECEREWSAGRVTKLALAAVIGGGLALAFLVSPWFVVLPALGTFCLVQYLFRQPCLMSRLVRAAGFRPLHDIDEERLALKALRGDFKYLPTVHDVDSHDAISRFEDEGGPALDDEHLRSTPQEAVRDVLSATRG